MKIYGDATSGNCLKVKYAADFLSLDYVWEAINTQAGDAQSAAFQKLNPAGQVPVLALADGRCLAQSNAILYYLAENTPLLPVGRFERAKVSEWLFWEQYSHEPYIAVCRSVMFYGGNPPEAREPWRVERGERALDIMEMHLTKQKWLAYESITIADIALLAYTRLADQGGFDLSKRPHLKNWIARAETQLAITENGNAG